MAKNFSWSYSKYKNFEVCPRRHYEVDILKNFVDSTEALVWGNEVHKAMADAVTGAQPLPPTMTQYQPWVDRFKQHPGSSGQLKVEQQYAMKSDFTATGWKDWGGAWVRSVVDLLKLDPPVAVAVDWKGLSVDTPIPTPRGFVTMGKLQVGDEVFGRDGLPYPVLAKSAVKNIPCYEVQISSGYSVVCDNEHLWLLDNGDVVPVTALERGSRIPLPEPVATPPAVLPIDPYVFGLWLADGCCARAEITKPDQGIWDEVVRRGYTLGHDSASGRGQCRTHGVLGIRGLLVALGVLGNKHIPLAYMFASVSQRLDLLRGYMDGDGSANAPRNQVQVCSTNKDLLAQVVCLARSLGERVYLAEYTAKGFGLVKPAWIASWRPRHNPFLLARKRDIAATFGAGRAYLEVKSVDGVVGVPTQCISVGSPDNTYLCGIGFLPTHNTGKILHDPKQLMISSQVIFAKHPNIWKVHTEFAWLKEGGIVATKEVYDRRTIHQQWGPVLAQVKQMEDAARTLTYPPKPGRLCGRYCPVISCPFHGQRHY